MSDIPFVNRLGDAMDAAIAAPAPARRPLRGRRRLGALALAVLVLGAGGVTVARLASDPEQLAIGSVACYERPDLTGDVSVLNTDGGSPVAACAEAWRSEGRTAPPLVACARGEAVAVIPGRGATACARNGLDELPPRYARARARLARLSVEIGALEASADCIAPRSLARRAQALLDRSGWTGWRAVVRRDTAGPCGRIALPTGGPALDVSGALVFDRRELRVGTGAPYALGRMLYGERPLAARLMDSSGERCFTPRDLRHHSRAVLAPTGKPVSFRYGHLPRDSGIESPRGDRYERGCAIVVGAAPVYPEPGVVGVEVEIWRKGL